MATKIISISLDFQDYQDVRGMAWEDGLSMSAEFSTMIKIFKEARENYRAKMIREVRNEYERMKTLQENG